MSQETQVHRGGGVTRGAGVNLLGNVLAALGYPLLYLVVSRVQGPEVLGGYVLVTYYIAIFFRLSVLGFDKGVLRHVPMARVGGGTESDARLTSVLGTAIRIVGTISLLFTSVVFLFPEWFLFLRTRSDMGVSDVCWWLSLLVIALPAQVLVRVMLFAIRGLSVMWVYVVVQNVIAPLSLITLSVLPMFFGMGEKSLVFGFVSSAYIALLTSLVFFRRYFKHQSIIGLLRSKRDNNLVAFSWPQGLTETLNFLLGRVDVIMIAAFFPDRPELVAFYGIASLVAGSVKKVRIAFDNSFSPVLAEYHARGDSAGAGLEYGAVARTVFTLFVLFGGTLALSSRFVLGIYGPEFAEYWLVVPILVGGRLVNGAFGTAQAALLMSGKSKLELVNNILINLGNIALNLVLIPKYHVFGAAFATSISLTVFNVARVIEVGTLLKLKVSLVDILRIAVAGLLAAVPGLGFFQFYGVTTWSSLAAGISFLISFPLILFLVGNRRDIRVFLRKVLVRGGRHSYLGETLRNCELSKNELEEMQIERLRDNLRYAGTKVPYWRELFEKEGFDPGDVTSVEDLKRLPVLTKEIIREQGDRMISEEFDVKSLIPRKTGGSTGEPLHFYVDKESFERQMAVNLRSFKMAGVELGDRVGTIWGYGHKHRMTNLFSPFTGRIYLDAFDSSERDFERWYRALCRLRPVAIYGYASAVHQFARYLARTGRKIPKLKVVCTSAEILYPEARKEIESGLGAKVADFYGCHEAVRLASDCLHGNMHMAPDAAVMEFVQESGLPEGSGRILLTSLLSKAMPFIRYDVGDVGTPLEGLCPCGNGFPMMKMDVGKVQHVFNLPGEKRVHSTLFIKQLYKLCSISAFQVRHVSTDRIEIIAVASDSMGESARSDLEEKVDFFKRRLGPDVEINAKLVEEIPKTPSGKQPSVVESPASTRRAK